MNVPEFHEECRQLVVAQLHRDMKGSEVAKFFGIPIQVVYACLSEGYDMGPLLARKVGRVEIARRQAEKNGETLRVVEDSMRYKGGRDR